MPVSQTSRTFNLPFLSHPRGNVNFPRRQRCNKCPEGSGGAQGPKSLHFIVLSMVCRAFTGLTQDFAGLLLHILWSDISLVDHEAIRSIRAPRSRHSWASGRRHCAAVRCQGLRSLAMKPSKQISSNFIKHQHKLSVADMEYLRCDVSQFSCCIILREMLQF